MTSKANAKAKRRAIDREELRRYLSENNRIRQIIDNIEKLEDEKIKLDGVMTSRINSAISHRLSLLKKYLPDEKSVEIKNADGEEFKTSNKVEWVIQPVKPVDETNS